MHGAVLCGWEQCHTLLQQTALGVIVLHIKPQTRRSPANACETGWPWLGKPGLCQAVREQAVAATKPLQHKLELEGYGLEGDRQLPLGVTSRPLSAGWSPITPSHAHPNRF